MRVSFGAFVLDDPAEIRDAEVDRLSHRGQLHIVDEDDAALLDEASRVDQVEEHPFEAMRAVDERQVETLPIRQQAWQDDLRLLGVELDDVAKPCLLEIL